MLKTSLVALIALATLPAMASGDNEYTLNKSAAAVVSSQGTYTTQTYTAPTIAPQQNGYTVTTVDPCTDSDPTNDAGCIGQLVYDTQPYTPDTTTTYGLQPYAAPSSDVIYTTPTAPARHQGTSAYFPAN